MNTTVRASLGFSQLPDGDLSPFAGGVIEGLTLNTADLPALPVSVATVTAQRTGYDEALVAMVDAGPSATAAKNAARKTLVSSLRQNALYVEIKANNNMAFLLSCGYQATSSNRTPVPLAQVDVLTVEPAQSGELKVRVKPQRNARAYEGRIKAAGSEYGPSISFASSRKLIFKGLTAGVTYTLQLRALGGSTGSSDWSDPISKMAV